MATLPAGGSLYGDISSAPGRRGQASSLDTSLGDLELDLSEDPTFNEAADAQDAAIKASRAVTRNSTGLATSVVPGRAAVLALAITTAGSGYTGATGVVPTGGSGTGLTITTTVTTGALATVTITAAGTNYRVGDVLAVPGGTGGTLTVTSVRVIEG